MRNKEKSSILPYTGQESKFPLSKDSWVGILGSGQLGQMMTLAAQKMGYQVVVYDTLPGGPATSVANKVIIAPFEDTAALDLFAAVADVITLEFENIPAASLDYLAAHKPVFPSAETVRICQDRILEKEFLQQHGFPVAPFYVITSAADLEKALAAFAAPCILKTATLGYDGRGQALVHPGDDTAAIWSEFKTTRAVLEKKISFETEASVLIARSLLGEQKAFSVQENSHQKGILHTSIVPPLFQKSIALEAARLGEKIAEAVGMIGVIAVEFFVLPDASLIVNELAPRPHNSGHHTLESSQASQFDQAIAAVVGLPLGPSSRQQPAVMVNLLGDLWSHGEPRWDLLLKEPNVTVHLYGKKEAKPGRKMGHFTVTGMDAQQNQQLAFELFKMLTQGLEKR